MRKSIIFAAALWAICPAVALAQIDPDWSRREVERMQAQQERFNAQVERQRAEQERFMSQTERQRTQQEPGAVRGSGGGLNWLDFFANRSDRRRKKAVGKMLAAGDCAGAKTYALKEGDFDLLGKVKDFCAPAANSPTATRESSWVFLRKDKDGTAMYADAQSLRRKGDYFSVWTRAVLPAANPMREAKGLAYFRCSDRTFAFKRIDSYSRDGKVNSLTVEDRDLEFASVGQQNKTERKLFNATCDAVSTSK